MKKNYPRLDAKETWFGYFFILGMATYNIFSEDELLMWQDFMAYSLVSFAILLLIWMVSLIKKRASRADYSTVGWKEVLYFTAASFGAPLVVYLFDGARGYWAFSITMQILISVTLMSVHVRQASSPAEEEQRRIS